MSRIASILLLFLLTASAAPAGGGPDSGSIAEIEAFNRHYLELHQKTDHAGILATWAEDGVDLLPGTAPMIGKPAIAAFLKDVETKYPGTKVAKQELDFHDIRVSGDWASEWANTHQIVNGPDGKQVFEGWGKIALVLHRDATGQWKVEQEMWNESPKP